MNKMQRDRHAHHLVIHAGELVFGRGRKQLRTLLGSCVAITLRHPRLGLSGMCHYVLPRRPAGAAGTPDARYGDDCLELFRLAARRNGTNLNEYEARIYGGGNMLAGVRVMPVSGCLNVDCSPVGEANAAHAFAMLAEAGVRILEADVGEDGYRKVEFDPITGHASVEFAKARYFY
ncbi:chemotaxis protein CheD [Marinobacterium iners]|uniref:chemotaxis protein CheD n=1 Tax=Marinobacterium iners TaxID=48076 RepID=UPI001A8EBE94|nr:chemotaxis protein CheD [Marinobacterium iners]